MYLNRRSSLKLLLGSILITVASCGNQHNSSIIYVNEKSIKKAQFIELSRILSNPENYESLIVDVIGEYNNGFEESGLYLSKIAFSNSEKNKALWISFNNEYYPLLSKSKVNLLDSYSEFEKISGKKVRVKGKFTLQSKGHLSKYVGTIENVFYVEVLN